MATIKNLIGLDIGGSSVKLVKFKKVRNKIQLEKARAIELKDAKSLPAAIAALLKSEKIHTSKVAVSISGQSVFTRYVKLPKISQKKIEQVVKYEAQQQIPFPIDKVIWDYQLFENSKSPQLEVFLSAVKKDIIDNIYRQVSQVKGLDVVSMQAAPVALYNILKFSGEVKNDAIILDFGAKITNVVIAKGKQIWIRSIPIGGDDLTKAISKQMKTGPEQAEAMKRKEGIILAGATGDEELTPRSDLISKAISPVLTDLLAEIMRSISYYKSQFDKTAAFQEILLTGGASKIMCVERFFEQNLKIKTRKVNLLKGFVVNKYMKANLDVIEDRLGVAMGLGLPAVQTPVIEINLISREQRKLKEFGKKEFYIIASEIVLLGIFLMLSFFCSQSKELSQRNLLAITGEMDKYRGNQRSVYALHDQNKDVEAKLDFLGGLIYRKRFWLDVIAEINAIVPKEAWLTKLTTDLSREAIIIEGKTTGPFDTVKSIKENLLKLNYFSEVETLRADRPSPQEEEELEEYNIIFTLKLKLKKPSPAYYDREKEDLIERHMVK
ncbi:MAG: type IV pilus assembly protein PilM [Candidatus Omnitrophica bacterium]|nr:type IV pilus assembly protein PilM [Candidatus Omnitrophota bacterium]